MGQVYLDANAEAVRRGDRRVGTDHVVLALLADRDSVTARALGWTWTPRARRWSGWIARRWRRSG
ncbi:Clp protease N-terminal domain-containing protein [Polymorphospora rubra]